MYFILNNCATQASSEYKLPSHTYINAKPQSLVIKRKLFSFFFYRNSDLHLDLIGPNCKVCMYASYTPHFRNIPQSQMMCYFLQLKYRALLCQLKSLLTSLEWLLSRLWPLMSMFFKIIMQEEGELSKWRCG